MPGNKKNQCIEGNLIICIKITVGTPIDPEIWDLFPKDKHSHGYKNI